MAKKKTPPGLAKKLRLPEEAHDWLEQGRLESYTYNRIKIHNVVDGDTFDVLTYLGLDVYRMVRVRTDYDAWEMFKGSPEHRERGKAAKEFVEALFNEATHIEMVTRKDTTGKYGRTLATIYVDGAPLGSLMAEAGHLKEEEE